MTLRWWHFGTWPSTHDCDLLLDTTEATYAALEALAPTDNITRLHEGERVPPAIHPADAIPLPNWLTDQAIDLADGLPLDLFLVPQAPGWTLKAWVPAPYHVWEVCYGRTGKGFRHTWYHDATRPT